MSCYIIPKSAEIIEDMPFDDYKAIDRINQSYLKKLVEKSPLHAEHQRNNPSPSTASQQIGTLQHAILFGEINPHTDLITTNARRGSKDWKEVELIAGTREIVKQAEFDAAIGMYDQVPQWLRDEIADMKKEVTVLFDLYVLDSEITIPCKARIDLLGTHEIRDYKTTSQGVGEREFQRMLGIYYYDLQAAFYQLAYKAVDGRELPFQWIVQETSQPYDIAGYEASDENLANGYSWLYEAVRRYAQCLESGEYRGTWNSVWNAIDSPDWHLYEPKLETVGVKEVTTL